MRWTFYSSDPWLAKRYSEELPREALRAIFIPLWNCYSFFVTYALLDKWTPSQQNLKNLDILDQWIFSAFRTAADDVTRYLEAYDVSRAAGAITDFIESLSNWYIRRSRKRFWKSEDDTDKNAAYSTLYSVLVGLTKLLAPFAPFISESIYQNLVRQFDTDAPESVHLCGWDFAAGIEKNSALEAEMALIQEAASLTRALRKTHNLKTRQPLSRLILIPRDASIANRIDQHLSYLAEEVNIKDLRIENDTANFVDLAAKPNFAVLGPRFGKLVNKVIAQIRALGSADLAKIAEGGSIELSVEGESLQFSSNEITIEQNAKPGFVALSGKALTVVLDTTLTPELLLEGDARELISLLQRARKDSDFDISDRIEVELLGPDRVSQILQAHEAMIARECLAVVLNYKGDGTVDSGAALDVNGMLVQATLRKHG